MRKIVQVSVVRMDESCERTTYFVRLTTDEGFHTEPCGHRTGSVHVVDGERIVTPGLDIKEALQRALSDAGDWADLLEIEMTPYEEDGVVQKAAWNRNRFTMQRLFDKRRAERETTSSGASPVVASDDDDLDVDQDGHDQQNAEG
jgi:hypothetical protein